MRDDPRVDAARYRIQKWQHDEGIAPEPEPELPTRHAGTPTASDRSAYIETVIQQAIRRGEFDNLPGAGKPLAGLSRQHDPDWWIRQKIRDEQLSGLGPPALTLRVEHTEFAERIDQCVREEDARAFVEDFNRRVIEARRQLLGGPPVVTPTHEVEAEIVAWRRRRAGRS